MNKNEESNIPYLPPSRDFYGFAHEQNCFDPLGSYTGRTVDHQEIPVQDADDL